MSDKVELTKEKSEEQARIIMQIALPILQLDLKYLKQAKKAMREDAHMYDSAAALNMNYNPTKSDILLQKAEALGCLIKYVEALKAVDGLEDKLKSEEEHQDQINKLFGFE